MCAYIYEYVRMQMFKPGMIISRNATSKKNIDVIKSTNISKTSMSLKILVLIRISNTEWDKSRCTIRGSANLPQRMTNHGPFKEHHLLNQRLSRRSIYSLVMLRLWLHNLVRFLTS